MSTKLKAIKQTAMMVVIMCLIPIILTFLFTSEVASYIFLIGILAFFIYIMYSINLAFIEFEERFKNKE